MGINKKPVIVFDQEIFNLQKHGGISRYFSKLINGLQHSDDFTVLPHKFFSTNYHLHAERLTSNNFIHSSRNFIAKRRLVNIIHKKTMNNIKQVILKGKFDIFHPTYYQDEFLNFLPPDKPFVITVHDMIPELYKNENFKSIHVESKAKSLLIAKAKHIIAISLHTKNDILSLHPEINPNKISVIHHGYSKDVKPSKKKSYIFSNYILFVGKREFYKNFEWMITSISDFLKENNFVLICAGGGVFNKNEIELINKNKLESKVIIYDAPDDGFLNDLYRNALCFVFPSIFEGFGLPILEAFANNCPAILARASCFPEVAGDAALYFELNDADGLVNQLVSLIGNVELRNNLIHAGNERLKNFGWQQMVDDHKRVYESILHL